MLVYQLRLALKSLRRNPILSSLLASGIALGIAVSMVFVTARYRIAGNPIPQNSDRLFHVQLDGWNPEVPWDDEDPNEPPNQLTYTDAVAVKGSGIPTYSTVSFKASLTVHPQVEGLRPYRETVRMTYSDFFPMFDVPFQHGGGWDDATDQGPDPVIVLGEEANQKLFGGRNSVGEHLRIEDREFRVVGVMAPWRPLPKFYDTNNDEFEEPEHAFMPFQYVREFEVYTSGNSSGWKASGPNFSDWLASENVWVQGWVQLDDTEQKAAFEGWIAAYITEQKKLGRFGRPLNYKLRNVMEWLEFEEVVGGEVNALTLISLLFLLVCSVNLVGILLGKFLARAPEIGVRRALGASRGQIFLQHVIECELIGVIGGVLGLGLTILGLRWIDTLFSREFDFQLDWVLFGVAIVLASVAAMVAGAYPAWRICRIEPAVHLKTQ